MTRDADFQRPAASPKTVSTRIDIQIRKGIDYQQFIGVAKRAHDAVLKAGDSWKSEIIGCENNLQLNAQESSFRLLEDDGILELRPRIPLEAFTEEHWKKWKGIQLSIKPANERDGYPWVSLSAESNDLLHLYAQGITESEYRALANAFPIQPAGRIANLLRKNEPRVIISTRYP